MPKITLRDLFALVTIVALALGWWLDHRRQQIALHGLHREVELRRVYQELSVALEKEADRLLERLSRSEEEVERLRREKGIQPEPAE